MIVYVNTVEKADIVCYCVYICVFLYLRTSLIDKQYWKHPNMIKFIDLLRSENDNTLRTLATFIHEGFQL